MVAVEIPVGLSSEKVSGVLIRNKMFQLGNVCSFPQKILKAPEGKLDAMKILEEEGYHELPQLLSLRSSFL